MIRWALIVLLAIAWKLDHDSIVGKSHLIEQWNDDLLEQIERLKKRPVSCPPEIKCICESKQADLVYTSSQCPSCPYCDEEYKYEDSSDN